ncbi:MAG: hypothetical protein JWM86_734 [Thermoleophilia bacterium]|nr:hypothetical protein [Thermoleophilia bacterium]
MHPPFVLRRLGTSVALVAASACAFAPSAPAKAELTISPPIIERTADAGDDFIEQISAGAGADQDIVVELVHADFGFDDASYDIRLINDDAAETTAFSTRNWFSLPKRTYRIKAGTTMSLPLRIKVPRNTPGGTYLGAALLRVQPGKAAEGSQVQAVPQSGPLLFIKVSGGDPPKARLARFDVPRYVSGGPITPKLRVENTGDDFFRYEGTVKLSGPGKDRTLKIARQYVVPGQPRDVRTTADKKRRQGELRLGSDGLGFGRYEVTTRLRVEPTGKTLVASRTFWVIPTWVRIVAVAIAIVFAASLALLVRWWLERRRLRPFLEEELASGEDEDAPEAGDGDDLLDDRDDESYEDEPSDDQ